MNLSQKLNEYRVGKITFPFSNYLYNRRNILKNFKNLKKSEYYSETLIRELQFKKLSRIIEYVYKYVPFYIKKFKDIGFHPKDLKQLKDLEKIPPLTKDDVIDFHKKMVDFRFQASIPHADKRKGDPGLPITFARFRKHKLVRNTSSGSTGAPTVFYEDGSQTALNWVHEMRLKSWFGVSPGVREARLVRISTGFSPKTKINSLRKALWNQLLLPGMNLSDYDYGICWNGIFNFRPKVIYGIPSALSGLAEYIKRNNIDTGSYLPELIIGWAGPVYEHEERTLNEVFDCPVSNIYGSREVGHVAGKCPHGSYHINQENLIVESESLNNNNITQDTGEILVTTINKSPMPIIRYRMGDIGEAESSRCDCGRTLQVLTNIMGRTGEIFITKDGRMISPNFWGRFFFVNKFSNAVRRFQIIYKKNGDLKIKIERDKGYSSEVEDFIKHGVKDNFSSDIKLDLEYVPKIKPQISGKYQMVVNEANS